MGFNPAELIYLQIAAETGLGSYLLSDLHCYTLEGDKLTACTSLESLRADPPFEVNCMLME
jgi:hypothetical protein